MKVDRRKGNKDGIRKETKETLPIAKKWYILA
jgi:hypothetical protein